MTSEIQGAIEYAIYEYGFMIKGAQDYKVKEKKAANIYKASAEVAAGLVEQKELGKKFKCNFCTSRI